MKSLLARVWLRVAYKKNKRLLDVVDIPSDVYERQGLVASQLEDVWERPRELSHNDVRQLILLLKLIINSLLQAFDGLTFISTDGSSTFLKVSINRRVDRQAEVALLFVLSDGTSYRLPGNKLKEQREN